MAATGRHRGHLIRYCETVQAWVYCDTGLLVSEEPERACGVCSRNQTPEGHDPCLGTLPGVMNACCGHGVTARAYVQLPGGHSVQGKHAISLMTTLGGEPPAPIEETTEPNDPGPEGMVGGRS